MLQPHDFMQTGFCINVIIYNLNEHSRPLRQYILVFQRLRVLIWLATCRSPGPNCCEKAKLLRKRFAEIHEKKSRECASAYKGWLETNKRWEHLTPQVTVLLQYLCSALVVMMKQHLFLLGWAQGVWDSPKDSKHHALPELGIRVPWISLFLVQPYWIHYSLLLQLRKAIILVIKSLTLLFLNFNSAWQLFWVGIFITRKTLSHDSRILPLVYFYQASNNRPIWTLMHSKLNSWEFHFTACLYWYYFINIP